MVAPVALIESVFQFWSLHEAVAAGAIEPPSAVILRGSVRAEGGQLPVIDPRIAAASVQVTSVTDAVRRVRAATDLIVGDPFSKVFAVGSISRLDRLTLLDDGASSLHLARVLSASGRALTRAHDSTRTGWSLGRLTRFGLDRRIARDSVRWVTGLPIPAATSERLARSGLEVIAHDWAWFRSVGATAHGSDPIAGERIVLGSALAADGHVDGSWYREWLVQQCSFDGTAFVPHRRERSADLDLVNRLGARVIRTDVPVEFALAAVREPTMVSCLPSTPALTLPRLRGGLVALSCAPVPTPAWSPTVPGALRSLLDAVADQAAASPGDHASDP